MSERDLHRAVARATGEFVETIRRLGFRLDGDGLRDVPGPQVFDWDGGRPAYLQEVVYDEEWPGGIDPLPSWDEEFDGNLAKEPVGAAA